MGRERRSVNKSDLKMLRSFCWCFPCTLISVSEEQQQCGDFLNRVGRDPLGGFSNNPNQFQRKLPCDRKNVSQLQISDFYPCVVSSTCPHTWDNF